MGTKWPRICPATTGLCLACGNGGAGVEIQPSPCRLDTHEAASGHTFLLLTTHSLD